MIEKLASQVGICECSPCKCDPSRGNECSCNPIEELIENQTYSSSFFPSSGSSSSSTTSIPILSSSSDPSQFITPSLFNPFDQTLDLNNYQLTNSFQQSNVQCPSSFNNISYVGYQQQQQPTQPQPTTWMTPQVQEVQPCTTGNNFLNIPQFNFQQNVIQAPTNPSLLPSTAFNNNNCQCHYAS